MVGARRRRDGEIGAEEGSAQFGDEFLGGIAMIAPALAPHIAGEARRVPGPVSEFVQERGVIAFGIKEALERRHLHPVGLDSIESPVAAVIDASAGRRRALRSALPEVAKFFSARSDQFRTLREGGLIPSPTRFGGRPMSIVFLFGSVAAGLAWLAVAWRISY